MKLTIISWMIKCMKAAVHGTSATHLGLDLTRTYQNA